MTNSPFIDILFAKKNLMLVNIIKLHTNVFLQKLFLGKNTLYILVKKDYPHIIKKPTYYNIKTMI